MAAAQLGVGFLLVFEGGLLDWGFYGYLGAGVFAWAYNPSTGDVVSQTKSIQGGLPKFLNCSSGIVTLGLSLPRHAPGAAFFSVQGVQSREIPLPTGAVAKPAACLLSESQVVRLALVGAG